LAHRTSLVIAATLLLASAEAAAVNRVLHRKSEELDPASEAPAYTPPRPLVGHHAESADDPRE
ncbi:hypothetical protein, partial [Oryzihumus sp.]|uniref:hypothetical protein n=1 Tax=Oryzihumus sp. TaxID=1968903 RepID=UPI002EDA0B2F